MSERDKAEQAPATSIVKGVQVTNQYVGPLPHPAIMQGFGEINPSFPERIMAEFEKNSEHTRQQEKAALDAQIQETARGQWMAFAVILLGFGGTMALAYAEKNVASVATGVCTAILLFKGVFQKKNN
ncbi:MAG: DUF2335 domain-containing protein [Schwartzia sp.]|nr:DUF2335 domain-containing protein [Schwartzia sp. (in: firmicutes)]